MSLLLLLRNSVGGGASAPTIVTVGATVIAQTSLTLQGQISNTGGASITRRGFQINTVDYPDVEVYEDGSFGTGFFTLTASSLTPGQTYYFRAFATNSAGTSYGSWIQVTTLSATYAVVINSIDRTADVLNQTIYIEDVVNDQQNTLSLSLMNLSGDGIPDPDEEITITLNDGTKLFGGYITRVDLTKKDMGSVVATIRAIDYVRLLDRNLVHQTYENMTDKAIIEDIVNTYCVGFGITTTNVIEGVTIDQISFNYLQPSQCFRKIADLTGRNWFIDYDKDVHYFPTTTNAAPFNISSLSDDYFSLKIQKDASQIKNRVYVRGGTKLSDFTTYSVKGDGVARQFVLPDKPHSVTVTVNSVSKTVGIKNIDLSGYDYYLNFQEKYIEQDSGAALLTTSDTLAITYKYDIPILVALEEPTSIIEHGVQEFAIFDKSITTTDAARARASAELTDYASNIIEGSFETYTHGFKSGQYVNISLTEYDVSADYIVQKVVARSLGSGMYAYQISLASAKTMGIIRFLIELLEANKNLIELDDNEVIDELFNLSDSLLSDSLTDSLTIDSAGAYSTWAVDSLEVTQTRAVWDLFQWG